MHRLDSVEALRGLASLAVMWFHFSFAATGWLKASGTYCWLGVPAFFVISGFVIPLSMHRGGYALASIGRFLGRRVMRLEPPYLVAIVVTLALTYLPGLVPGFQGVLPEFDWFAALLHIGYLNPLFDEPWLNPVYWSLAVEFQFYLFMGLLFPLLRHGSRAWVLAGFCMTALLPLSEISLFRHAGLFTIGIAAYWYHAGASRLGEFIALCAAGSVATGLAQEPAVSIVAVVVALLIVFVRLPRIGVLAVLGTISYSLYLLHLPIGLRVVGYGVRFWDSVPLAFLAGIAMSLLAAYVFWRYVEHPFQAASRRYF